MDGEVGTQTNHEGQHRTPVLLLVSCKWLLCNIGRDRDFQFHITHRSHFPRKIIPLKVTHITVKSELGFDLTFSPAILNLSLPYRHLCHSTEGT